MKDEFSFLNRRIERHKESKSLCTFLTRSDWIIRVCVAADSTHSRVFWWSFFQIVIVVAVVAFQVTYMRGTFEKKRMV